MSDAEEPKREDKVSQTNDPVLVQTVSFVKVTQTPEPQPITINFYTSNLPSKLDKPVQTDSSCTELLHRSSSNLQNRIEQNTSQEIRNFEFSPNTYRKIVPFHETWRPRFMNFRKVADSKASARAASDLERKRLEAEYKATEELAKIQKTVIEKRLALELASLEDSSNTPYHPAPQPQQQPVPQSKQQPIPQYSAEEKRLFEELKLKQKLMNRSTEPVPNQDSQLRLPMQRSLMPTKTSLIETQMIPKADSSGSKQNSSESNPLRHLLEKKLNIDLKSQSKPSFFLKISPSSSQERDYNEFSDESKFKTKDLFNYAPDEPSCSPEALRRQRTANIWKMAYMKIKKRVMQHKGRKKLSERYVETPPGGEEGWKSQRSVAEWQIKQDKTAVDGVEKSNRIRTNQVQEAKAEES